MKYGLKIAAAVVLDYVFICITAWMMWWNAGRTVADLTLTAVVLTTVAGAVVVFCRFLLVRPLVGNGTVFLSVFVSHVCAGAALVTAWAVTASYLLGWFATCASLVLIAANVLQLLIASASKGLNSDNGHSHGDIGLTAGVTAALGACSGFVGLVLTAPVHNWSATIINLTIVIAAVAILAAGGVARSMRRVPSAGPVRQRQELAAEPTSAPSENFRETAS